MARVNYQPTVGRQLRAIDASLAARTPLQAWGCGLTPRALSPCCRQRLLDGGRGPSRTKEADGPTSISTHPQSPPSPCHYWTPRPHLVSNTQHGRLAWQSIRVRIQYIIHAYAPGDLHARRETLCLHSAHLTRIPDPRQPTHLAPCTLPFAQSSTLVQPPPAAICRRIWRPTSGFPIPTVGVGTLALGWGLCCILEGRLARRSTRDGVILFVMCRPSWSAAVSIKMWSVDC